MNEWKKLLKINSIWYNDVCFFFFRCIMTIMMIYNESDIHSHFKFNQLFFFCCWKIQFQFDISFLLICCCFNVFRPPPLFELISICHLFDWIAIRSRKSTEKDHIAKKILIQPDFKCSIYFFLGCIVVGWLVEYVYSNEWMNKSAI